MRIPSLFRPGKPKPFSYTPLYYDQEKEEREERLRRIKSELGMPEGDEEVKPRTIITRGSFNSRFRKRQTKEKRTSAIRLLLIILLLILIIYVFWLK